METKIYLNEEIISSTMSVEDNAEWVKMINELQLVGQMKLKCKSMLPFNPMSELEREIYSVIFDSSVDVVWFDLNKQLNELKDKIKEREKFLQNLPAPGVVDPENGNFIQPPVKTSETQVIVKL